MPRKSKSKTTRAVSAPVEATHIVPLPARVVRAGYDVAQTNDENRRHWEKADSLSADAALISSVRRTIRIRSRYEVSNNSYAKGIGLTIANDTVGTGPTLQMLELGRRQKKLVETLWWEWAQEINLVEKLRLTRFARFDSGELFSVFRTNTALSHPVKLDIQLVEAEEIADPTFESLRDPSIVDGIRFDREGNPVSYRKLRTHPGSFDWNVLPTEYDDLPASFVWHYFRADRPGQHRGIPDITPALQLFAELRRYCNAVIAAAETAADFAMVLKSLAPPDTEPEEGQLASLTTIELMRRMATVLPHGYEMQQTKAEQPTTTYDAFVNAKLKEIARCLCVPFHIATLDPSMANMSSSYVVGQFYAHERLVDRACFDRFLDRLFRAWLREAQLIGGLLPELPPGAPRQWFWPSLGHHADPAKVANARATNLASGMTTIPHEYAMSGLDYEEQQELAARSLGISVPEYQELLRNKLFGAPAPATKDDEDEEETQPARGRFSANGNGRH